nr:MAG TPA: hypothetical protein [Caudoviricetes sp.]
MGCYVCSGVAWRSFAMSRKARARHRVATQGRSKARIGNGKAHRSNDRQWRSNARFALTGKGEASDPRRTDAQRQSIRR